MKIKDLKITTRKGIIIEIGELELSLSEIDNDILGVLNLNDDSLSMYKGLKELEKITQETLAKKQAFGLCK